MIKQARRTFSKTSTKQRHLSKPSVNFSDQRAEANQLAHYQEMAKNKGVAQKRVATGMAGLGGAAGDADLYNIPGVVNLPQGIVFTETLAATANVGAAIDRYIVRAQAIGTAMTPMEFLDKNSQPPNIPNLHNFNNPHNGFHQQFEQWARLAPGASHAMGHAAATALRANLVKAARQNSRNNGAIGLIDPFITRITIPQTGAQDWIFETNWSESANSYITLVKVGSKNLTGRIRDAGTFAGVRDVKPYAQDFQYSSAHDQGTEHTVGEQIENLKTPGWTQYGSPTNEENHPGFDAVTKLAAEGARFAPVRAMGTHLKQDTKFFTTNYAGQIKYLTFQQLYANWGAYFNRQYGINAATIAAQINLHGADLNGQVDLQADYDITNDTRAINRQPHITGVITGIINSIEDLQTRRTRLISSMNGLRGNRLRDKQNRIRGLNQRLARARQDLQPYNRHYRAIVDSIRNPPPPPPVVANSYLSGYLRTLGLTLAVGTIVTISTLWRLGFFAGDEESEVDPMAH